MRYVIVHGKYDHCAHRFLDNCLCDEDVVVFVNASNDIANRLIDVFGIKNAVNIHYYYTNFDPDNDTVVTFSKKTKYAHVIIDKPKNPNCFLFIEKDSDGDGDCFYMNSTYATHFNWLDVLDNKKSYAVCEN